MTGPFVPPEDGARRRRRPRVVVKVGSALLTNDGQGLDEEAVAAWVEQMVGLQDGGFDVVLVSSGAIVEGMRRLGWRRRPEAVYELQAAAAVGQMGVVQLYESCFQRHARHTAQVLLTHDDFASFTEWHLPGAGLSCLGERRTRSQGSRRMYP